jgi:phosphatidylserine/phosphatidylglycerophosphate/cardiolipin synthase-like enzyme
MTRMALLRPALCGLLLLVAPSVLCPHAAGADGTTEIYYAPEDRPGEKLAALYDSARQYIYVAMYGLTAAPAVRALTAAKRRGVDVRVITDRSKLDDPKQRAAVETLALAGVPIRINQHDALMHLKQVVVDDRVNTNGSMNQTTSGDAYNDERLDIIHDPEMTVKAREKFLRMWGDESRFRAWQGGRGSR